MAAGGALIFAAISTATSAATGTLIAGSMMTHFLVTTAMGAALNALAPRPNIPSGSNLANQGYQVSRRGAAQSHQIIYGQTKVGGAVVYDAVSGTNNKILHRVIAFTGHEIEEFTTFYFNDETLTLTSDTDGAGQTYYKPTNAVDSSGNESDRYSTKVRIYYRLGGTDNATPLNELISSGVDWTDDHLLQGCSFAYFRLEFDADVFPNGVPEITALIKGKKVYDTRTATTAWSANPALCIRDYLTNNTYGIGEATARIDDDLVTIAADVCDFKDYDVNDADPFSTKTGGTRFSLNGAFTTDVTPHDHIMNLLTAMGGVLWYGQGKWRMKPAHYVAPTLSFNEDDLRSSISVSTRHSRRDNFNIVKGIFRGPETDFQPTDYKEVKTQAFITADNNEESTYQLDLPYTNDFAMCRHLALITLERNRQQLTVQASFGMRAFQLAVGDIIQLSNTRFGFVNKEFEVIQWTFGLTGEHDLHTNLTLREISESVFDDIADGAVYEQDNTTLLNPFDVPACGIVPANVYGGEFKVVSEKLLRELQLDVTTADAARTDRVEVQYKLASDAEYIPLGIGEAGRYSVLDLDEATYNARARAINTFGVKGEWSYTGNFDLAPLDAVPADIDPDDIAFEVSGGTLFIEWEPIADLDLSYYRIKYSSDLTTSSVSEANTLWGGNSVDAVKRVARPATFATVPARSGTFLIRAYDKAGNVADNTGFIVVPAASLPTLGVEVTQTDNPAFNGNTGISNSNISVDTAPNPDELTISDLSAASNEGIYYLGGALSGSQTASSADFIDLASSRTATVSSEVTFARHIEYSQVFDNIPDTWDTWPDTFDDWTNEDAAFGDFSAVVQVRATGDDPSSSPSWGAWENAIGQQLVGRGFQFRAKLNSTNVDVSPAVTVLKGIVGY